MYQLDLVTSLRSLHNGKSAVRLHVPSDGDIWGSLEELDREGSTAIEPGNHDTYLEYHRKTQNTIFGRHVITVLMYAMHLLSGLNGIDINTFFSLPDAFLSAFAVNYKDKYPGAKAQDYRTIYQGDLHSYVPFCSRVHTHLAVR